MKKELIEGRDLDRAYAKAHYRKNKEKYLLRNKSYQPKYKAILKTHIANVLKDGFCIDCGESDPVVLEFDHVYGKKRFNIGDVVRMMCSLTTLMIELQKCVIRCANCHRKKTYLQRLMANGEI